MFAQSSTSVDWGIVGPLGIIVLGIIVTGIRRYWLFTWVHERIVAGKDAEIRLLTEERDRERAGREEWQTLALTQAGVLEQTVRTTTEIVRQATEVPPK